MSKKNKKSIMIKSCIMPFLVMALVACLYFFYDVGGLAKTLIFAGLFALSIVVFSLFAVKNNARFASIIFYTILICLVVFACYLLLSYLGWLDYLESEDKIRELIGKSSPWGEIIFVLITFAQVTLVPIPSTITIFAGVIAFGVGGSIIYSTIGLLIGSMFAFFLGRVFGMKIVRITIGEGMYNKYQSIMKGKDVTMLFLMFLLPLFPDDLLCIVAGLTSMSYLQFFIMMLITRPIGVSVTASSAKLFELIPLDTWWGYVVWGIIIIAIIALAIFLMKYSNIIQDRMFSFFDKYFNKARQVRGANLSKIDLEKYHFIENTKVYSNNSYSATYGVGIKKKSQKRRN